MGAKGLAGETVTQPNIYIYFSQINIPDTEVDRTVLKTGSAKQDLTCAKKIVVNELGLPETRGHLRVSTAALRKPVAGQRPGPRPWRHQQPPRLPCPRSGRPALLPLIFGAPAAVPQSRLARARAQPLLPFALRAAPAGPARNPPASPTRSQSLCAIRASPPPGCPGSLRTAADARTHPSRPDTFQARG